MVKVCAIAQSPVFELLITCPCVPSGSRAVDGMYDHFLRERFEAKKTRTEEHGESVNVDQLPLCERIAYDRAVKKGLSELRALNIDFLEIDAESLYNDRAGNRNR